MSNFTPGERVRVTVEGFVQAPVDHGFLHINAGCEDLAVPLDEEGVTVERIAPAEWPPQPGDLWKDSGDELWFALQLAPDDIAMVPSYPVSSSRRGVTPDRVMRTVGPLTLVHREGAES